MANAPVPADAPVPETLIGPLLHLFTRLAHQEDACLGSALQSQLVALVQHPAVGRDLKLAAGALLLDPGPLLAPEHPLRPAGPAD